MKHLILFAAVLSLTLFAACNQQEIEDGIVPVDQDKAIESPNLRPDNPDAYNSPTALTADFTIDNEGQIFESDDLIFSNNSVDAVSYEWDFGDGVISYDANPRYHYKIHGFKTITLTTTDALGNSRTSSQEIEILCIFGGGPHDE